MQKQVDAISEVLTKYACNLEYATLPSEAVHVAKVRLIDALGALVAGFFAPPCVISRGLAASMPNFIGATVVGTRMKAALPMAVFANATTARYVEMTDTGLLGGHPSDVVLPLLSVAEYAGAGGRQLISALVLAYEVYIRVQEAFHNKGFDHTNFATLAVAVGAGKLLNLSPAQLAHCISMAIIPNNALRVSRRGHLSMWKVAASGQAGQGAVFAALLARAGMEGPHLPFEGKSGWCDHVAAGPFSLGSFDGDGVSFKIQEVCVKVRPCGALAIPAVLAAEKIAPLTQLENVKEVVVEVFKKSKDTNGTATHHWHPDSKETADHSTPYLVAATLMDGRLTLRSYNNDRLWNPQLRDFMQKIKVIENSDFTRAHEGTPQQNRTRITVSIRNGEELVAESGGDANDLAAPKSDAQMVEKFREASEDILGMRRVNDVLGCLWQLEKVPDVSVIPPYFIIA